MKKKILVTGGTGLVGKAIQSLNMSEYRFIFMDSTQCDLTDYEATRSAFETIKPTYVIHLAACVGGLFKNMEQKVKMLEDNLLINTHVLKSCYLVGTEKVICCLSTCIFPDKSEHPINETMLHDGPPHSSNEGYAHAKRILEVQCRLYNQQFGTKFICIIPTNIYGPHDNFNLDESHVIPGLIHRCHLAKLNGEPFIVKGSGRPLRQFIYSTDLATIIMEMVRNYDSTEPVILSPSEEHSIQDISEMINSHFGNKIQFDTSCSDGQYKKTADNARLLSFFPGVRFTSIQDGIARTVEWFKKEYPSVRK
jgi:GDP-L-fucose synthase